MKGSSEALLLGAWHPLAIGTATSHARLALLLAALEGSHIEAEVPRVRDAHADDTLGDRNRRLLALHSDLVGTALEARVTCRKCGVASEFPVPADAIRTLPRSEREPRVKVRFASGTHTFRLPTMADLEAARNAGGAREVRLAIIERCRVGEGGGAIPELVAHRLAARFEALDPAANIVVNVACSGCAAPLAVSVDVARFVAHGIDRLVESLLREIHLLAAAYGWDEAQVLAVPPWRRRRYIELIASAGSSGRGADGWQAAVASR